MSEEGHMDRWSERILVWAQPLNHLHQNDLENSTVAIEGPEICSFEIDATTDTDFFRTNNCLCVNQPV